MLELDIGVVHRPDNTVDVSVDGDEESRVAETLDRSLLAENQSPESSAKGGRRTHLDDLANFDVANTQERLLEDGGLEGELNEPVERGIADHSRAVDSADLPWAGLGHGRKVVVGNPRNLFPHQKVRKWQ